MEDSHEASHDSHEHQVDPSLDPSQAGRLNRSSVQLQFCADDSRPRENCSYCRNQRQTFAGEEHPAHYFPTSFICTKLRSDDYESLLARGFTRCGSYLYLRSIVKSCCESYNYKVDTDEFTLTKEQTKCLRRFHRYLQTGQRNVCAQG